MKNNSDFEVGTSVKHKSGGALGTVIGNKLSVANMVAVEWDSDLLEKVHVEDLVKVDLELERDYAAIQQAVWQAASSLKEANALAAKHATKLRSLEYDFQADNQLIDISDLFIQIQVGGWSTSGMSC